MAKVPTASQRARKCIFCDNNASSKGEHFLPVWMHKLLPTRENPRYDNLTISYSPSTGTHEKGPRGRQGALGTIKIRVVCAECNSQWMNRLEAQARPFLTALIQEIPIALDGAQIQTVAEWIALKCMVREHAGDPGPVTTREECIAFRTTRRIPDHYRIYVANYASQRTQEPSIRHANCVAFSPEGPRPSLPVGITKNVQTISFFMGRVFVHLNSARVDGFNLESRVLFPAFYASNRIWPPSEFEMVWPRRPILTDEAIGQIANTIPIWQDASTVRWVDGPDASNP